MKKLVIVESPTKANTIKNFLSKDINVIASMGHICDIPDKGMNVDLKTFKPVYEISSDKKDIVKKLKAELKNSSELYLATDEDREGESISWHLENVLKPKVPVKRMVFHEITKNAIEYAFNNTRSIDMNMVHAQESRRVLDRLFGYKVSNLLWVSLGSNHLSAGRVQSPTLRLITDREYKRMKFKSMDYCVIKAIFETQNKEKFDAVLYSFNDKRVVNSKEFFDETTGEIIKSDSILLDDAKANEIQDILQNAEYRVTDTKTKEVKTASPLPFITSTLQQDANIKLKFSSTETMSIAQKLYESGFITYMRTDSPTLSKIGTDAARKCVKEILSEEFLSESVKEFKSKDQNAQNAHEAIRPAVINNTFIHPSQIHLNAKEVALYDLIYKRTLASQMKDNIRLSTTVKINGSAQNDNFVFGATGYIEKEKGFRKIYEMSAGQEDDKSLPLLNVDDLLNLFKASISHNKTSPAKRWTEASLIKEMEKIGIGRPSTYAFTISSLIKKKYVKKVDNNLIPTFTGLVVIKFLEKHLSNYIDYEFTSKMEEDLEKIEKRAVDEFEFLQNFYDGEDGLSNQTDFRITDRKSESEIFLPMLDEKYHIYFGKYGTYITDGDKSHSIAEDIFPYQLDSDMAKTILSSDEKLSTSSIEFVAKIPGSGKEIYYNSKGRYGSYFYIKDEKNFISLPKGSKRSDWSSEEIIKLFSLPYEIGEDDNNNSIMLNTGRYGAYISYKNKNISIKNLHKALNLKFEDAIKLFEDK